jgi:hypothetical protein
MKHNNLNDEIFEDIKDPEFRRVLGVLVSHCKALENEKNYNYIQYSSVAMRLLLRDLKNIYLTNIDKHKIKILNFSERTGLTKEELDRIHFYGGSFHQEYIEECMQFWP